MGFYRNFRVQIVIRIMAILALGYAMLYISTQTHFWLVAFWIALAVIGLLIELIRFIERSNRDLANFLISISQNDFTNTYSPRKVAAAPHLHDAFNQILAVFHRLRDEKEVQHQYLQTVVEHVSIALLCYDSGGHVQLMNAAAKTLFRKPFIKHIQSLDRIDPLLRETISRLESGQKALLKSKIDQTIVDLSIQATQFKLHGQLYTLLSFQDIRYELEAQEVESWQKLIRVLTHEIMNSVIPISTLTSVVNEMLVDETGKLIDLSCLSVEDAADLQGSLETIESRSKGLVNFVKAYKSVTQIATPAFTDVSVEALFQRVYRLLKPQLDHQEISWVVHPPSPGISIKADPEMIEQVLINLVLNAVEAVADQLLPNITLSAAKNTLNQTLIQITDNGKGMSPEVLNQIFVPFYTTKPQGSGIGLSLSKQIMLLHKGNIRVQSTEGQGSVFVLEF